MKLINTIYLDGQNELIFSAEIYPSPNETGGTASNFALKNSVIPK